MNTYICISGDILTYHSGVDEVIGVVNSIPLGNTSYEDIIRSLTPGSTCDIGPSIKVSYIGYVMSDTMTFELSSSVEPVPTISTPTYMYIHTEENSYNEAPMNIVSDPPIDMSSVYYGFTAI